MVKIILDDEMSDYISRVFSSEIKTIHLDSRSGDIKREFGYFMKELLSRRKFANPRQPFIYDTESKFLLINSCDVLDFEADLYNKLIPINDCEIRITPNDDKEEK